MAKEGKKSNKIIILLFCVTIILFAILSLPPVNSNACQDKCNVEQKWGWNLFVPWVQCVGLFKTQMSTEAWQGYCLGDHFACTCYGHMTTEPFCQPHPNIAMQDCPVGHLYECGTGADVNKVYSYDGKCAVKNDRLIYSFAVCIKNNYQFIKECTAKNMPCKGGDCKCIQNYGNCDSNNANGCEEYIINNDRFCGSCTNDCTAQGKICSGTTCVDRPCTISSVLITPDNCTFVNNVYHCKINDTLNITANVLSGLTSCNTVKKVKMKLRTLDNSNQLHTENSIDAIECSLLSNEIKCSIPINEYSFLKSDLEKFAGTETYPNPWNITRVDFEKEDNSSVVSKESNNFIANGAKFSLSIPGASITDVTIDPLCSNDGCDLIDNINVDITFSGYGEFISWANLIFKSADSSCTYNTSFFRCEPGSTGSCTTQFEVVDISNSCLGKSVYLFNSSVYTETKDRISYSDSPNFYDEDFLIAPIKSELSKIDLIPNGTIDVTDKTKVFLRTLAWLSKNGAMRFMDKTISDYIKYSINNGVANLNITSTDVFIDPIQTNTIQEVDVASEFPIGYSNKKEDSFKIKIWPRTPCQIKDSSIDTKYCGDDGCNISEKVTMNVILDGCASVLSSGTVKMLAWDDQHTCIAYMGGTINYPNTLSTNWTIETQSVNNWSECQGKTVKIMYIGIWNSSNQLVSSDYFKDGSDSFGFWGEAPPRVDTLLIWPKQVTIQKGQTQTFMAKAVNSIPLKKEYDLTNTSLPYYQNTLFASWNPEVANNSFEPRFNFQGLGVGDTHVEITYPWRDPYPSRWPTPISGNSLLYVVEPTGCQIYNAQIIPYCTDHGKCQTGNTVTLKVTINDDCINSTLNMNNITFKFSSLIDDCSFDSSSNQLIYSTDCANGQTGQKICVKNISLLDIGTNCANKKVYAYYVEVKNTTNVLASLTKFPPQDFGNFTFSGTINTLTAVIDNPIYGSNFDYLNDPTININFNQSSYPVPSIIWWAWSIKKDSNNNWILMHNTTHQDQADFTWYYNQIFQNLSQPENGPGSYLIKHEVSNSTLIANDFVNIYFCKNGWPCAIISHPYEQEIIYNSTVGFDGSTSFDSDSLFNLTWFFGDNTNISGDFGYLNKTQHIYSNDYAGKNILAKLNVSDGKNSTIDYVNFTLAYCLDTSTNQKIIAGTCLGRENKYCDESKCNSSGKCSFTSDCRKCNDCEKNNKICNETTGNCMNGPTNEECSSQQYKTNETKCNAKDGCYYDDCKSCVNETGRIIQSCSDYGKPSACNSYTTNCHAGTPLGGGIGTEDCGSIVNIGGENYLISECKCSWNTTVNSCGLNKTYSPQTNGVGSTYSCNYKVDYSECGEENGGCLSGARKGRWVNYTSLNPENPNCIADSKCQPCGVNYERLPFFGTLQLIISLIIISMIYVFIRRGKR